MGKVHPPIRCDLLLQRDKGEHWLLYVGNALTYGEIEYIHRTEYKGLFNSSTG